MPFYDLHMALFVGILGLLYIGLLYFGLHLIKMEDRLEAVEKAVGISPDDYADTHSNQQRTEANS